VGIPSGEAFGAPTLSETTVHVIRITPMADRGDVQMVELCDPSGSVLQSGMGTDLVDALLEIIRHMLPPGHPERAEPMSSPDDEL
jgi:hypothetical protein